jgi:hypothetical protein
VQVSFAQLCIGVDLRDLTDQLCSPSAAAPLSIYMLYQLGPERSSHKGLVASDAAIGEGMQRIIAEHGFGRIQLFARWTV